MEKALAVLLLPEFSELEAALALEAARRLGLPAYTVAKGRKGTLALAGSVWTPTYAFPAAPQPRALVIPGARRPRERARDPAYLAFLEEVWEGLEAVFVGFNAHLFLEEAGRLPEAVAGTFKARTRATSSPIPRATSDTSGSPGSERAFAFTSK